jgi:phosphatidylglycerophosphate synthase
MVTAILLATAPGDDVGGRTAPAAALPWEGGTILRRLLQQLASLGVDSAHVVTRPGWEEILRPSLEGTGVTAELTTSPDAVADLRAIAAVARGGQGAVLLATADVVTHREALAGLLADPRVATGVLCTGRRLGHAFAFRTRAVRGRVVSAASPYHAVHRPNLRFLGVLKVAAENRATLADVADRLATLAEPPLPPGWDEEWRSKRGSWRLRLARLASEPEANGGGAELADEESSLGRDPATATLSPEDEAVLDEWVATGHQDAASLVVVGLVRSQVHVALSHLRELFWARPLSRAAAARAGEEITGYDEDRVLLDSAVKANDGFFTTFLVSPYSKYIARWAARRGLTPNQVTIVSLAIGVLAAVAFATGDRAGLIAGAVLLQISFTTDCVDGQLARYARMFSRLGAWLDSVFDRTKEYAVFAGLAIGASRSGDPVWVLAGAALALQTARHAIDFSYPVAQHQVLASARQPPLEQPGDRAVEAAAAAASAEVDAPPPPPERGLGPRIVYGGLGVWRALNRWTGARWLKKIVAFPIGERFAVISITAAVASARTTFVVLLAWGGFAAVYKMVGRVLRSAVR